MEWSPTKKQKVTRRLLIKMSTKNIDKNVFVKAAVLNSLRSSKGKERKARREKNSYTNIFLYRFFFNFKIFEINFAFQLNLFL